MRADVTQSFEDFERIAEDYFHLIPPDTDSFDLTMCEAWEYKDEAYRTLTFYFEKEWDLDQFYDKITECPKYEESYDMDDNFEGVDREKLTITIEAKEGGLIS